MLGTHSGRCLGQHCGRFGHTATHERYFRQPKIQNLSVAALGHEDIGGLYVTMNDASAMRSIEGIGNLNS
jgi:hypothetical protein